MKRKLDICKTPNSSKRRRCRLPVNLSPGARHGPQAGHPPPRHFLHHHREKAQMDKNQPLTKSRKFVSAKLLHVTTSFTYVIH